MAHGTAPAKQPNQNGLLRESEQASERASGEQASEKVVRASDQVSPLRASVCAPRRVRAREAPHQSTRCGSRPSLRTSCSSPKRFMQALTDMIATSSSTS